VTAEGLIERLDALFGDLERAGVSADRLVRQAVVSPVDMLNRLSVTTAERALQLVAEVSASMRARYELV
jgi:hypothetical protein